MGRHTLSTTALAHKLIAELKPLADVLPPNERRVVEKFFDTILQQRVAISEATDLLPIEAALVILLVEEHRRNDAQYARLYEELRRQIRELSGEVENLARMITSDPRP
jgi:hypothetical protein